MDEIVEIMARAAARDRFIDFDDERKMDPLRLDMQQAVAGLRTAGYSIHRFHDWKRQSLTNLGPQPDKCARCGALQGGLLDWANCDPKE